MVLSYDPNDSVVPYRIIGMGYVGGLPNVELDENQYPDVYANIAPYKIDPTTQQPVHMTQVEIDALTASAPVHEPTTEERLAKSEDEGNKLRQKVASTEDMLNGLVDYLSVKSVI